VNGSKQLSVDHRRLTIDLSIFTAVDLYLLDCSPPSVQPDL